MNVLNRLLTGAALGLAVAVTAVPMARAETPPNMLVIASVLGWRKTSVFVFLVVVMATISGMIYGTVLA